MPIPFAISAILACGARWVVVSAFVTPKKESIVGSPNRSGMGRGWVGWVNYSMGTGLKLSLLTAGFGFGFDFWFHIVRGYDS